MGVSGSQHPVRYMTCAATLARQTREPVLRQRNNTLGQGVIQRRTTYPKITKPFGSDTFLQCQLRPLLSVCLSVLLLYLVKVRHTASMYLSEFQSIVWIFPHSNPVWSPPLPPTCLSVTLHLVLVFLCTHVHTNANHFDCQSLSALKRGLLQRYKLYQLLAY